MGNRELTRALAMEAAVKGWSHDDFVSWSSTDRERILAILDKAILLALPSIVGAALREAADAVERRANGISGQYPEANASRAELDDVVEMLRDRADEIEREKA